MLETILMKRAESAYAKAVKNSETPLDLDMSMGVKSADLSKKETAYQIFYDYCAKQIAEARFETKNELSVTRLDKDNYKSKELRQRLLECVLYNVSGTEQLIEKYGNMLVKNLSDNVLAVTKKQIYANFSHKFKDIRELMSLLEMDVSYNDFGVLTPDETYHSLFNIKDKYVNRIKTSRPCHSKLIKRFKKLETLNCEAYRFYNRDGSLSETMAVIPECYNPSKIKSINMNGNILKDISYLNKFENIEYLELHDTMIDDVSAISGLTKLKLLNISNNKSIKEIAQLKDLKDLTILNVYGTDIADLSLLENITDLVYLHAESTKITDLKPLRKLVNLKYLGLDNTEISDISPLKNLKRLEHLSLNKTNVSDVSPLKDLTNLKCLSIEETPVTDVSALNDLKNLSVYTKGSKVNPISKIKINVKNMVK